MKMHIDGCEVIAAPGESLRELVCGLGFDTPSLVSRPLAAKMAGEVFNLNYIPVRAKEAAGERSSIRRAMAASGGKVHLLRYTDSGGRDVYKRTSQCVMFLGLRRLWPEAKAKMTCKVGSGIFINVTGAEGFCAHKLKARVQELVAQDIPLRLSNGSPPESSLVLTGTRLH